MFYMSPSSMMYWFLFALPGMILAVWAQARVKKAFNTYSKVHTMQNVTGAQVARALLDSQGLYGVDIEPIKGKLTDHYDPRAKILRLSEGVYDQTSIAAAGIAAHEMGHALQDDQKYAALGLRSAFVPAANLGSRTAPILFSIGFMLLFFARSSDIGYYVAMGGVLLFGLSVIFTLITLPVEFDASRRAKKLLVSNGILIGDEIKGVNKVLDAAAWTYVAAAVAAIGQMLYYIALLNRRR